MFDYAKSSITAKGLIQNFGRVIQHISVEEGSYDVETSGTINTETSTDCIACDFSYKGNQYDGDLIQVGDRYAVIDSSISNIDVSDKLVIDGVRWSIVNVNKVAPAGVLVLWKVQIRK